MINSSTRFLYIGDMFHTPPFKIALCLSLIFLLSCSSNESTIILTISPGWESSSDPAESIELSSISADSSVALREINQGFLLPLQYDKDATWRFLVPDLSQTETYQFELVPTSYQQNVICEVAEDSLNVSVDSLPVLTYQMGLRKPPGDLPDYYQRSGFIHPVFTPDGQVISDDFPAGHPHQHGVFAAWVNTKFEGRKVDFWNQQHLSGTIVFDSLLDIKDGPVFGEFRTGQHHLALNEGDTTLVLDEIWRIRVYRLTSEFVWEITLEQRNVSESPLEMLPYIYGGMAFRGSAVWNDTTVTEQSDPNQPGQADFVTSEQLGRIAGNHTRPEWVRMFGEINNRTSSITVHQKPGNPGYPQYVRIHPVMPYFCFFPVLEEGMVLSPGDTYTASYRVVVRSENNSPD